jgi:branched-chain amino acid aminotransferase
MPGSQDFLPDPRNEGVLALRDGDLVPASTAQVSIFDAGFGLGDGVWEGLRLHKGALLFLGAHLDRLYAGAAALRIDIGRTREELTGDLVRLLQANAMTDGAHLRLMVTRGRKRSINQDPRQALGRATIVCTAEFKLAKPSDGLVLATSSIRTSGRETFDLALNTHSRLNYILALLDVIDTGADEAVMLDPHGAIASCNATNLFWVKDGTVHTSGPDFCFPGITRGNVIALCRAGLAPITEGAHPPASLAGADEAFVTGTMGGVTSIRSIDGREFPAVNGPLTRRIADAYAELKDADAAAHPLV